MTQQFLNHLHVSLMFEQESRERVPERVPSDPLSDPELPNQRLDVVLHHFCQPERLPSAVRT